MRIAIYGRPIKIKDFKQYFISFTQKLVDQGIKFEIVSSYQAFLSREYKLEYTACIDDLTPNNYKCLISLGGDGTILDTLSLIKSSELPVMGINLGRLGFLANIKMEEIETAVLSIKNGNYSIEKRVLLEVVSDVPTLQSFPFALNDFVVQKRDTSAMITVKAYLNGDFLNNYWSDGLIVSTPTGSSGYSLSCGGPLIFPGSQAFVITPIAAHNLTVRPAVIPDTNCLDIEIKGRGKRVLVSLDARSFKVPTNSKIRIKKASFTFNMIRLSGNNYMDTLRNKLLWGTDKRDEI
jgi:NAD+ kinase